MRRSREIGWSTEENLIYDIISKMNKLNALLPGNQPASNVRISRQIGWSNKEILLYEWLKSLSSLKQHSANCC